LPECSTELWIAQEHSWSRLVCYHLLHEPLTERGLPLILPFETLLHQPLARIFCLNTGQGLASNT
jgi:hypothetical protein